MKVRLTAGHEGVAEWASLAGPQSLVVALPHCGFSRVPLWIWGQEGHFPKKPTRQSPAIMLNVTMQGFLSGSVFI